MCPIGGASREADGGTKAKSVLNASEAHALTHAKELLPGQYEANILKVLVAEEGLEPPTRGL